MKRKAKTKTEDKIKKALEGVDKEELEILSDSELKHDNIREKERKKGRKKKEEKLVEEKDDEEMEQEDFFETVPAFDDSVTFYQMNLSRPLMKAIADMKFVHPTPIQAATIPPALLGIVLYHIYFCCFI